MFQLLKGPRDVLLKGLRRAEVPYLAESDAVASFGNILRLCRICSPRILEDGFGDFLTDFACYRDSMSFWHAVLDYAGYSATAFISQHFAAEEHIRKPLRVYLTENPKLQSDGHISVMLTASDPHRLEDSVSPECWEEETLPQGDCLFESHQRDWNANYMPPVVCVLRQEGTELHFECGITDDDFSSDFDWKLEQDHLNRLQERADYYTEYDIFADADDIQNELISTQLIFKCLLSNLVKGSVSLLTSII